MDGAGRVDSGSEALQFKVDRSVCSVVLDELCNDQQGTAVSPGVLSLVQCCFAATEDVFGCAGCVDMRGALSCSIRPGLWGLSGN